jgi:hypothetical protein
MNKQILENRLIDSVALVINLRKIINLLVKYLFWNISRNKVEIKKTTFTRDFMNWHSNQKIICLKLDIKMNKVYLLLLLLCTSVLPSKRVD